jgi:DMSO/TMAO reductase YedYZ molybdopterin-dependent catalytic subunit
MAKCKDLIVGCGLAVAASFIWLVSSCTEPIPELVPNQPPKVAKVAVVSSATATEPPTLSSAATAQVPTTATQAPSTVNTTPVETQATTPTVVITPTPTTTPITPSNIGNYLLDIDGLVNNPLSLSYAQIQAYPSVTQTAEIYCPDVEDEVDQWTGVLVSTLLNEAGVTPGASEVVFRGVDGFYSQLPLQYVLKSEVFLAYQINGQTLSQDRGYPLRLVVVGSQGTSWLRWVTKIEVKSALVFFSDPYAIIPKLSVNIPPSGSKLCLCLLPAAVEQFQAREPEDFEIS